MSFLDLATLAMVRRAELEDRIDSFTNKCNHAVYNIQNLKLQAQGLVDELNCEPSELKNRFLGCMKKLDEFIYLITDFNLCISQYGESNNGVDTPDHDFSNSKSILVPTPVNLLDALTEPIPSYSGQKCNITQSKVKGVTKRRTVPREDLLIEFSSASVSTESVSLGPKTIPEELKSPDTTSKTLSQINVNGGKKNFILRESMNCELPAQKMLDIDKSYSAVIIHVDALTFYVITEPTEQVTNMSHEMHQYYSEHSWSLTKDELDSLIYCAFYDKDTTAWYRSFKLKANEDAVELFLVDIGELRVEPYSSIQPLPSQFCKLPPFGRACHLYGLDIVQDDDETQKKVTEFMKDYEGKICTIRIEDNSSESLGVYVDFGNETVNHKIVESGLAVRTGIDPKPVVVAEPLPSTSATVQEEEIRLDDCPEYEDALEAVQGYHNRDEADICKHYKGEPYKSCFKGARCKKKHIRKHPDGWTLDQVEVIGKGKTLPLPKPGTWHKVRVTHVCYVNYIYMQFVTQQTKEEPPKFGVMIPPRTLEDLIRDMNSLAAKNTHRKLTLTPAIGELVLALYPPDGMWYRARVIQLNQADQSVEVIYVDYGTQCWVRESDLCELSIMYAHLPFQAIRCKLADIKPFNSQLDIVCRAKGELTKLIQDKVLTAQIVSRSYDELEILLYDMEGFSIAEHMATMKLVQLVDVKILDDDNCTTKIIVP